MALCYLVQEEVAMIHGVGAMMSSAGSMGLCELWALT